MPRGTSPCEDAVMETIAIGASCPWNLSTVPTRTAWKAGRGEGVTDDCDLSVVRSDDQEVAGNQRARSRGVVRVIPDGAQARAHLRHDLRGLLG